MNPIQLAQIPDRAEGLDATRLPLDAREAFVFSQIDGRLGIEEIADLLNQDPSDVLRVVERLVALGAVVWSNVREEAKSSPVLPPPEEEVDLDPERRTRILAAYEALRSGDHYAVLGVPRDADKQEIRTAYFQLSKVFHPDTLFGKRLGSYKPKMEAVFKRLTEAYEVLGKKKSREEYDAYLAAREATRDASRLLEARRESGAPPSWSSPPPPSSPPSAVHVRHPSPSSVSPPPPSAVSPLSSAPPPPPISSVPPPRSSTPPPFPEPRGSMPTAEEAARLRRERAARRLTAVTGRSFPHGSGTNPAIPAVSSADDASGVGRERRVASGTFESPVTREHVLRGLASSLHQAAQVTGHDAALRYRQSAKRSESAGDLVAAANSLRLAIGVSPGDREVRAEYERVQKLLAAQLAPTFETQALYEERHGRWAEAANSWARVVEGRPNDPVAATRAAEALFQAGGDLRRAKNFAQRAVDLAPLDARPRVTLARIFYRANMRLNARRELEQAAKLDPSDELVKNLLREMEP